MFEHPKFSLGKMLITPGASATLDPEDVVRALMRHARGDWGECGPEDLLSNEEALVEGLRLFSVYNDRNKNKFWVITEADRCATTVLLPHEY